MKMQGQCARCRGKIYFTALQADSGGSVVCPQCGSVNRLGSSKHGGKTDYYVFLAELPKARNNMQGAEGGHLNPEEIQRNYDIVEEYRNKTDFSSEHSLVLESDSSAADSDNEKDFRNLIEHEKYADTTEFDIAGFEKKKEKPPRNTLFEQNSSIRISYGSDGKIGKYALRVSGLLLALCVLYFVFEFVPWKNSDENDSLKARERKIVERMAAEYPAEASERMAYIKEGETAFALDTPESYASAADNFGRSFLFSPGNDEIIARYAESMSLSGKISGDIKRLQDVLEMLDYGLALKPASASLHRARARFFLALGQPDKAFADAHHAVTREPENPENTIVFAEAIAGDNPEKAIGDLSKVIAQDKFPIIALRKLADIYFNNGYLAEAEQMWKRRMDIDPESCSACLQTANLYESVGMYSNAIGMYNRLLESGHDEIEGMSGFARSMLLSGKSPSYVMGELAPLVTKGPDAENLRQLAEFNVTGAHMYIITGDFANAQKHNAEALKADASNSVARYQRILLRVIRGDIDDHPGENMAAELSDLALFLPDSPEVPTLAGRLYELRMQYGEAIAAYMTAIKIMPSYPPSSFLLAALHIENRVYDNAFKVLWRLADYSPDYWEQHPQKRLLADLDGAGGRLLGLLAKIEKYEVDIDELNFLSGLAAYIDGNRKSAAGYFRAVLKNNPEHAKAASWLAWIYVHENRSSEALALLHKIKTSDSQTAYLKALVKHNGMTTEERLDLWENFIRSGNRHPGAYIKLAGLYHRLGNHSKAVDMAQAAFRLDPESLETRSTLYVVGK